METPLDDILNGSTPEPSEPPVEEAQPPETIGQPRDDAGRFAAKETGETPQEAAEPVPPTEQPSDQGQYAALKDERRKRQDLERQLAEMRDQISRPQPQPEPPADFWEDPQSFMARQFEQFGNQFRERLRHEQQIERIDVSEASARSKYADYDDAFHAFRQAVETNPALAQQMMQSGDPAEFAYRKGRTALELERVGSIDDLLKAERAKWEAEVKAVMPAPTFPSTTATDGSVGARSGPAWSGPKSMDDLLR